MSVEIRSVNDLWFTAREENNSGSAWHFFPGNGSRSSEARTREIEKFKKFTQIDKHIYYRSNSVARGSSKHLGK